MELIKSGRQMIAQALQGAEGAERILGKIDDANRLGSKARLKTFFEEIALPVGELENGSGIDARHKMAHGGSTRSAEHQQVQKSSKVLEALIHRVIFRLLKIPTRYVDYSVRGFSRSRT